MLFMYNFCLLWWRQQCAHHVHELTRHRMMAVFNAMLAWGVESHGHSMFVCALPPHMQRFLQISWGVWWYIMGCRWCNLWIPFNCMLRKHCDELLDYLTTQLFTKWRTLVTTVVVIVWAFQESPLHLRLFLITYWHVECAAVFIHIVNQTMIQSFWDWGLKSTYCAIHFRWTI